MIQEYLRAKTVDEALRLMAERGAVPMGRGFFLNARRPDVPVVDLQDVGLDGIRREGNTWVLGATATLHAVAEHPDLPEPLKALARAEAPFPQRDHMTVAGALVAADGRSLWAAGLLALDARLHLRAWEETPQQVPIGDWLPLRHEWHPRWLITEVHISAVPRLAWEKVARTPADRPLLLAAVAFWPRGRTRVVVGGWGSGPYLAMDGPSPHGAVMAAHYAAYDAQDPLASAEYRREVIRVLVRRCLEHLGTFDPDDVRRRGQV